MSKIIEICGNYPDGFKQKDLENNPLPEEWFEEK